MSVYTLIIDSKRGNNESLYELINKFYPKINSLARKLSYDEYGKTDLIIFFIQMVYGMNLEGINNVSDGALVNYINTSLQRRQYKCNFKSSMVEVELNDVFTKYYDAIEDIDFEIFLDDMIKKNVLTSKQKYVLKKKYFDGFTDSEIAKELDVSRQNISKINKVAIKNLKEYLNLKE